MSTFKLGMTVDRYENMKAFKNTEPYLNWFITITVKIHRLKWNKLVDETYHIYVEPAVFQAC